jgi:hypothetical protein
MSASTPRFLIENHGASTENVQLALREAVKYCITNNIQNIVLVVPAKGHFLGGIVADVLGHAAKSLHAGNSVTISGTNISLTLAHPGGISVVPKSALLLGTHLSQDGIAKLDDAFNASAIVYVPWMEEEGKEWMSTWQPIIWGPSTWQFAASTMAPAVLDALNGLHSRVNVMTGLAHPADKEDAKATFKELKKGGHPIDPEEIKRWALRNGWNQQATKDLHTLAKRFEN